MGMRAFDRRSFMAMAAGAGAAALLGGGLAGCAPRDEGTGAAPAADGAAGDGASGLVPVEPTADVAMLEEGLSCVRFAGDSRLDAFLAQGGASSDGEVVSFLAGEVAGPLAGIASLVGGAFGCSTLAARTPDGDAVFGRNFDWYACDACIVAAQPEGGYASVSTVNRGFLGSAADAVAALPAEAQALVYLYAPLDGVNERGLAVAVLMIQDSDTIAQDTGKTGLTTTTAVRALLDRAGDVDEALDLLSGCDLHASMGYMVHFAIADAAGRAVAVEYVGNEMAVTETPVLTNFYVAEGSKHGVGTAQSHERFSILSERLAQGAGGLSLDDVRDALSQVSKANYDDGETTEWSWVCNQRAGEVRYYHREDFSRGYTFQIARG